MKLYFRFGHKIEKNAFPLALMLMLSGCIGSYEIRWKEQVWLHDGRFILIDRYATRSRSGFPNSRRGYVLAQEIHYKPAGFLWKSANPNEVPIAFDIIGGSAYLVVNAPKSRELFCVDKPKGSYIAVFYRWTNGERQEISQQQASVDLLANNVTGVSQPRTTGKEGYSYLSWNEVAAATGQPSSGPPNSLTEFFEDPWLHC